MHLLGWLVSWLTDSLNVALTSGIEVTRECVEHSPTFCHLPDDFEDKLPCFFWICGDLLDCN